MPYQLCLWDTVPFCQVLAVSDSPACHMSMSVGLVSWVRIVYRVCHWERTIIFDEPPPSRPWLMDKWKNKNCGRGLEEDCGIEFSENISLMKLEWKCCGRYFRLCKEKRIISSAGPLQRLALHKVSVSCIIISKPHLQWNPKSGLFGSISIIFHYCYLARELQWALYPPSIPWKHS